MNVIESIIHEMRENAETLLEMAGIYPGDPSGAISEDAWLLVKAANHLQKVNWEEMLLLARMSRPEVEVTYHESN